MPQEVETPVVPLDFDALVDQEVAGMPVVEGVKDAESQPPPKPKYEVYDVDGQGGFQRVGAPVTETVASEQQAEVEQKEPKQTEPEPQAEAEQTQQEPPAEEVATEETEEIPDNDGTPEWIANLRTRAKEANKLDHQLSERDQELAKLREEIAELKGAPKAEPRKYAPEHVFRTWAKIKNGDLEGDARDEQDIRDQVHQMTPEDLEAVIDRAETDGFGELSDSVLTLATRAMGRVQRAHEQRRETERQTAEFQKTYQESLDTAKQVIGEDPGMIAGFTDALNDLEKDFSNIRQLPTAPTIVLKHLERSQKAKLYDQQITQLSKENKELKRRLASRETGSNEGTISGGTAAGGGTLDDAAQELVNDFRNMGYIR